MLPRTNDGEGHALEEARCLEPMRIQNFLGTSHVFPDEHPVFHKQKGPFYIYEPAPPLAEQATVHTFDCLRVTFSNSRIQFNWNFYDCLTVASHKQ